MPVLNSGCKSFIDIDPPITSVNAGNVFKNDATAIGVLTGIYTNMSNDNINKLSGVSAMTVYAGLSADELKIYSTSVSQEILGYYQNNLRSNTIGTSFYLKSYQFIFAMNSTIEGLTGANMLTSTVKLQLLGEAYFIRAFCYFNMVNLFGSIPLVTSADYNLNSTLPKAGSTEIYQQIKSDLLNAQSLLSDDFLNGTLKNSAAERVRPTKAAATALLAKVYLYLKDWTNAVTEATKIISDKMRFDVTIPLADVFIKNSKETIWALQSVGVDNDANTGEGKLFILTSSGPDFSRPYYINDPLLDAFEKGDQRYAKWTDSVTVQDIVYHYPFKYKAPEKIAPSTEYTIIFRVAEQYLIRAEALIEQGNISAGIFDLNVIRSRATDTTMPIANQLKQLSTTLSKENAIKAVLHERQVELFTEWGNRWLDLKRTNTVDAVMKVITPIKGGNWDSNWSLYPIPQHEIDANPNLKQNLGY
jgi:hypothetical protein